MGLVILIALFIMIFFTVAWDRPNTKGALLKAIGVNFVLGVALGLILSFVISMVVPTICDDIEIKERQIYNLYEIAPEVYLTTGVTTYAKSTNQPNVKVTTDKGEVTVELRYCNIYLNNDNCAMEVRTYKYKNEILNLLFFNYLDKEYDIYVPQTHMNGIYSIHTD